jgi:hypothetical protein
MRRNPSTALGYAAGLDEQESLRRQTWRRFARCINDFAMSREANAFGQQASTGTPHAIITLAARGRCADPITHVMWTSDDQRGTIGHKRSMPGCCASLIMLERS